MGFLGINDKLVDVISKDKAYLDSVNITCKPIADRLEQIILEHYQNSQNSVIAVNFKVTNVLNTMGILNMLYKFIKSPTVYYFDFRDDVFYRDEQDCVILAFDDKGRVYIKDNASHTTTYVAETLPEFLSHIYDYSINWHKNR